jgi:hypothetical protein
MKIGSTAFVTEMIRALEERIDKKLGNAATIQRQLGTVATVDDATNTASVYLSGPNNPASEGFRMRGRPAYVGDIVDTYIHGQERWVEPIAPVAGTLVWSGTELVYDDDGLGSDELVWV